MDSNKNGPWGGTGGDEFDDGGFGFSGIRKLVISTSSSGQNICFLEIHYVDSGGHITVVCHGGSNGEQQEINLDYPKEVVTQVQGTFGNHPDFGPLDDTGILSLEFTTSYDTTYGPYGSTEGTVFSCETPAQKIVSFHGRSDVLLNSLGLYIKPYLS